MQFQQVFDARSIEPAQGAVPWPLADYKVIISETEPMPNSKPETGGHLKLTLKCIDGPMAGREHFYNLNLWHQTSPTSVEIAYRQLSALCHVTGVYQLRDTTELHNRPFIATIGPQTTNPQYSEVKAVKDINGIAPGKGSSPAGSGVPAAASFPAAAPAPAPAPAAPPAAAPAWAPPGAPAPAPAAAWPAQPAPAPVAAPAAQAPAWQPPAAGAQAAAAPPWGKS